MSKQAEQAALKAFPVLFSERNGFDNTFKDRRLAFEKGYEQAEKDTIERAIQWLIAHADDYIVNMEVSRYKPSNLHIGGMCYEHLKQAMEEE